MYNRQGLKTPSFTSAIETKDVASYQYQIGSEVPKSDMGYYAKCSGHDEICLLYTSRASVGVASYPQTCANPGELLTRADWAMYHSKKNGRDRITIDSEKISSQM